MLWKRTYLGLSLVLFLAGLGCDDSDPGGVVSCDFSNNGVHFLCQELPASYRQQLQQVCQPLGMQDAGAPSITYADGPCSRTNALGGCRMSAGGISATVWYYRPEGAGSPPDIQTLCKSAGATYVSP